MQASLTALPFQLGLLPIWNRLRTYNMATVIPFLDRRLLNEFKAFGLSFVRKKKVYLTSFITTNQAINYTSFFPFFSPSTSAPFLKEIWLVIKCTVNFAKIGSLWQKSLPGSTFFDEDEGRRDPSMFCVCVKERAVWVHECVPSYTVCKLQVKNDCFKAFTLPHHDVGGGRQEM